MSIARVTASLTAADTWSAPVRLHGAYNVVVEGTFVASWQVQRSFADPSGTPDWHPVEDQNQQTEQTGPRTLIGTEPEGGWFRFGIVAGGYTSGTVEGRISQ